jgi:phospholipid transport system substrate-binding protein
MQPWYGRITIWTLVGSLLLATYTMRAEAGEPMDKLRQTVNEVLTVVSNKALPPAERRVKVRQAVLQHFGFDEMSQRALGQHWSTLTPPQRQEFVTLFTDLLERSYMTRIESYNADVHGVRYLKEEIDQDHATVYTEIVSKRDLPAAVEYRLLHRDGHWKVYDIVIEGVSLVNNYRTQFNTIIVKDSYAGLVKQMRLKLEQENATSSQQG